MSDVISESWILVVVAGAILITCTIVFCCWFEKEVNNVLSYGHDEHEDNSVG